MHDNEPPDKAEHSKIQHHYALGQRRAKRGVSDGQKLFQNVEHQFQWKNPQRIQLQKHLESSLQ